MGFKSSGHRQTSLLSGVLAAKGKTSALLKTGTAATALSLALLVPTAAHAVDGCLVLLCFAAPSWKSIPQCVPPVRQVLRDLAHGEPFPTCGMSGAGNSASHAWARAPGRCPPQYTRVYEKEHTKLYRCEYTGVITVSIDDKQFTKTWWNFSGDTVTDFSPVAKSQLGSWDTRYDDEESEWLRSHP